MTEGASMIAVCIPMLAELFGGWEIVLILAIVLIMFGAKSAPDVIKGLKQGIDEFNKAIHEVRKEIGGARTTTQRSDANERSRGGQFILWIAQGFDVGRIPFAPGTFGSFVGLLWFAILLVPGSFAFYLIGIFVGLVLSVFFCGEAERILKQTDPGSVVLDEIAAIPICFLPWVLRERGRLGEMPPVEMFFTGRALLVTGVIFVLFRVFDVVKPWPVRRSQALPGGVGVTVDDLLAAGYVALLTVVFV